MLVGLLPASEGEIRLFGETVTGAGGRRRLAKVRRKLPFVFQDPHASLDPRLRVRDAIHAPLDIAGGFSRTDRAPRGAEWRETDRQNRAWGERGPVRVGQTGGRGVCEE